MLKWSVRVFFVSRLMHASLKNSNHCISVLLRATGGNLRTYIRPEALVWREYATFRWELVSIPISFSSSKIERDFFFSKCTRLVASQNKSSRLYLLYLPPSLLLLCCFIFAPPFSSIPWFLYIVAKIPYFLVFYSFFFSFLPFCVCSFITLLHACSGPLFLVFPLFLLLAQFSHNISFSPRFSLSTAFFSFPSVIFYSSLVYPAFPIFLNLFVFFPSESLLHTSTSKLTTIPMSHYPSRPRNHGRALPHRRRRLCVEWNVWLSQAVVREQLR